MPDFTALLIDHGILGIIVCLLGWWIKKQHMEAKSERDSLQDKLFEIIENTNKFDAHTGHQLGELRQEIRMLRERIEGKIR